MTTPNAAPDFQTMILRLQEYWARQGCVILQPYDAEVGAATFCASTFLACLGPDPWRCAHVQPCRRPTDGRYGENPFRFQRYYQFQVVMKPAPAASQELYLGSLEALGIDLKKHDVRFVEDDWESPTLGATGLGWEVWLDGMEVTQFTYFQQIGGFDLDPVSLELTYGLERVAMYLQGVDTAFDLAWVVDAPGRKGFTWGEVSRRAEREFSAYNFEHAPVDVLAKQFDEHATACRDLCAKALPLPAHDHLMHASHTFNLLDARGAIGVNQRAQYIGRVRELARTCAETWLGREVAK
ncbi:MAG: glycine--tRNA ligase subunit alpha [Planctomycetes bacterium]|nr:glycine--tRNA ligase subunit alpha [Planctomycetota bacterium]